MANSLEVEIDLNKVFVQPHASDLSQNLTAISHMTNRLNVPVHTVVTTGDCKTHEFRLNGELHRLKNKPARYILNPKKPFPELEEYFVNGKYSRPSDLPTKVERYSDSTLLKEELWHDSDGKLHRESFPYRNNIVNNESVSPGAAHISYDTDGRTKSMIWYDHGEIHRIDGPAIIHFFKGVKTYEEWRIRGVCHRENGPAITNYTKGKVSHRRYFINGQSSSLSTEEMLFDETANNRLKKLQK